MPYPIFQCKIDNFLIDLEDITDNIANNLSEKKFPFVDGSIFEDMGESARTIEFTAHFMRERYDEHKQFLDYIRERNLVVNLQHPIYGTMRGRIKAGAISHDSRPYFVTIALTFSEELQYSPDGAFSLMQGMFSIMDSGFKSIEKSFTDNLAPAITESDRSRVFRGLVMPGQKFISQINNVTSATRNILTVLDQSVNNLNGFLESVLSPVDAITNTVEWTTNLPGVFCSQIAKSCEKVAYMNRAISSFPQKFISNCKTGSEQIKQSFAEIRNSFVRTAAEKATDSAMAQIAAYYVSEIYDADNQNQNRFEAQNSVRAFDDNGRQISVMENINLLSANDLERSLTQIRQMLDEAMQTDRDNLEIFKTIALMLQRNVEEIRLNRMRISKKDTETRTIPLYSIIKSNGGNFRVFKQIMAINNIENPTFVRGEVLIYE